MRRVLASVALLMAAAAGSGTALAADAYPSRALRLVVPYPAGGGADGLARLVAQKMEAQLGRPIVIDNKPGANTITATSEVGRAAPDGYTLLYVASSFSINPSLYKLPYDTLHAFTPVAMVAEVPLIIIRNQKVAYASVPELVDAARKDPKGIAFASYGLGSPAHLGAELLESVANIALNHVPYKGSAPAMNDLIGGQINVAFSSIEPALQFIASGRVSPIAVMSRQRIPSLPKVPTVAETYPGFEAIGWNGIVAPAGTPTDIVLRLNQAVNAAIASPEVAQRYAAQGVQADSMTPQAFGRMIRDEIAKWSEVVRKADVKVE
jgi:tripartite-type tricarboxylate transporter receptor subunit TctC